MKKSQRIIPTVLLTILQVLAWTHLQSETLSNLLSLQEKNWQNSRLWRDQAYSNGHLCRDQVLRCWWLKYQQAVKRCVCICFFFFYDGEGRKESVRCVRREGDGILPVWGPDQPVHSYPDTGNEDRMKIEHWRLKISEHGRLLPEHFIPLVRRKKIWYFYVSGRFQLGRGMM